MYVYVCVCVCIYVYLGCGGTGGGPSKDALPRIDVWRHCGGVAARDGDATESPSAVGEAVAQRGGGVKVSCSYEVSALSKFALRLYMREFCCYVLLNFGRRSPAIYP